MFVVCLNCQHKMTEIISHLKPALLEQDSHFISKTKYECLFCSSEMYFYHAGRPKTPDFERSSLYGDYDCQTPDHDKSSIYN